MNHTFALSYDNSEVTLAGDTIALRITNACPVDNEWWTTTWLDNVAVDAVPIPEPASMALMLFGVVGLLAVRRRK